MILSIYLLAFSVTLLVVTIIASCFVWQKVGRHWFEALIPGWNAWALGRAVNKAMWPTVIYTAVIISSIIFVIIQRLGIIIPNQETIQTFFLIVGTLTSMPTMIHLSKSFGHGVVFGVLTAFLPFIFYVVLATASDPAHAYRGPQ